MTDVHLDTGRSDDSSSNELAPLLEREVTELADGRRITYYRRTTAGESA